jgi:Secretion system C-terminal sorting domain
MKTTLLFGLAILSSFIMKAQNGLEGIIVEKYYISDANDTLANSTDGKLPVGSVTYRVYADMLPGYKFQALFGLPAPDLHQLKFATTTLFFNNEQRGAIFPNSNMTQSKSATVMLDSWISVGAATTGNSASPARYGVLKTEDNGLTNVVNNFVPPLLQNADPMAGIPLTVQDGLILGATLPKTVTLVGITPTDLALIDNTNDILNGNSFMTDNGSIASLSGSEGPDLALNKVLLGQFTTDGIFTFEFNMQIGTPTGGTQQYVASNPSGSQIVLPALTYSSASAVPKIAAPISGFSLYPNPSQNEVKIVINKSSSNTNNSYKIIDVLGHVIAEKQIGKMSVNQVETVDISNLASGHYLFQLTVDGISSSKKIIKK